MARSDHIDDAAVEALLSGNGAGGELASLAAFVVELRSMASGPAPVPSAELAAMLAEGFSPGVAGEPAAAVSDGGRRRRSAGTGRGAWAPTRALGGLGLGLKAALSGALVLAGVTAAGAAGALPGPAQRIVSTAVEAVTPFELPGEAGRRGGAGPRAGTGTATTGGGEDEGGARGGGEGGGRPAEPGQAGLDRAGETPAAGHAPSSVPGGGPGTAGRPEDPGPPAAPPGSGQEVAGETPAAAHLPTTLPAGPPQPAPARAPRSAVGGARDAVPTLPTVPTVPTTLPSVPTTVTDTVATIGGGRR